MIIGIEYLNKKPLRIGIFNPTLYAIGGAEFATLVMIEILKRQGYRVIVSTTKKINPKKISRFYNINLMPDAQITVPIPSFISWNPSNVKYVYLNALNMGILRLNCDILIDVFSGVMLPWSDITYLHILGKDFRIKSIKDLFLLPYIGVLKSTKIERKSLIACSEFVAKHEWKKGLSCKVLYPPVDVNYFSCRKNLKQILSLKKKQVITVSRISSEKNLENIAEIAKMVNKNISFLIVGSLENYATLESIQRTIKANRLDDRVKVIVNISKEKLRELLLKSQIYLHTREDEPFGITIVEAMSAGCIPIVHDSGGPREFVPQSFRYKTLEECATKIEKEICQWTATNAFRMTNIAQKFNKINFSKNFLSILSETIENKFHL